MPLRDRLQEFRDSLPKSPYGDHHQLRYPLFPVSADYDRDAGLQKADWPISPPPPKPRGMASGVYRFYDKRNRLLYVGKSNNPGKRYEVHRYSPKSPWRLDVHHDAPIEWHESEAGALAAETHAMNTEHPMHNNGGIWFPHRYDAVTARCPCGLYYPGKEPPA